MNAPLSPWTAKAAELLADGEWRDREWLIRQLTPLVPPGMAMRQAEKARVNASSKPGRTPPPERLVPRSVEFQVQTGRRAKIVNMLSAWKRIETKTEDGKVWIRLRDPHPNGRTAEARRQREQQQ